MTEMRAFVERHALTVFFVGTYVTSWTLWAASGVLGRGEPLLLDNGWLIAQLGVFAPSLWAIAVAAFVRTDLRRDAALLTVGLFIPATIVGALVASHGVTDPTALPDGLQIAIPILAAAVLGVFVLAGRVLLVERRRLGIRTMVWSLAAASLLPILFLVGWRFVNSSGGGLDIGVLRPGLLAAAPAIIVLCSFDAVFGGALGEEIGWRGFALPRMLERETPLGAALVLGLLWSLWHLPIDLTAGFGLSGVGGVLARLLFTCALSVIVVFFFVHSGHGMLTSLLIHATLNWLPVLRFERYTAAMTVLFVLMFLVATVVAVADERMRVPPPTPDKRERQ